MSNSCLHEKGRREINENLAKSIIKKLSPP